MERLTKRNSDGTVGISELRYYNYNDFQKMAQKLAEYEDLEAQGLLLRLPCKVGDTVYYIEDNAICEFIVYSFDIRPLQEFVCNYGGIRFNLKNFGKTVFLTQEEAEQKLKEMESK